MPIHLVAADEFQTSTWSGGTSTQLWIYPKSSTLAARDFDFRLSSAKVETSGPFSDFSGYDRLLIVLNGQMSLTIDGVKSAAQLGSSAAPFAFNGASQIHAELDSPSVEDFNLFVPSGVSKTACRLMLNSQQRWNQPLQPQTLVYGIYLRQGSLMVADNQMNAENPLIISSKPLNILTSSPSDFIAFSIGQRHSD
ncbi:HutD family protein [Shewanella sp.]|uniref:HutD/Ves family protein n=1 Tax=Shewanella sp. TaxID=50422 RepID=UPI0035649914